MPGRGNNSVEFQVSLGLQGAQQQIDLLHKALEESVKIDSNGFKSISKMLENAQSQAEKLSSKMGEAFKTSSGSKNFLKDYQKMLETLSQIRSKIGNLGFEDIKFSVADQGKIDDTVKRMQDLEQILTNINKGKAIDIIVGSSVENVDILKKKINDLSIDTSKLTFDSLKTRLADAASDASNKLNETEQKIKNIETVLNNLDAKGLEEIQSKIGTSAGLSVKLIDDKSIDAANEKLRQLKQGMGDLSDKAKASLQVDQKTGDISKFIETQTENIKASYQKQIEAVRTSKETVNKLLTSINESGNVGKNNRTYYNSKSINEIINSEVMQASAETLGIDLSKIIDETNIDNKVRLLKEELGKALQDLQIRETDLTNLRDSFESKLKSVFEGLTTSAVSNVKVIKDKIINALNDIGIDPSKLKDFGFDISSISAGETLASIYDRLKTAVDNYTNSLADEHEALSSSELLERRAALEELEKAQKAANAVQGESSQVIKEVQEQIAECRQKIQELIEKYQELTGKKIEVDLGDTIPKTEQATTAVEKHLDAITKLESKQKALSNVQSAVTRWMGFYQVLNLTRRAINDMKQHIQELDTVMTKIAVVTNMTQQDLWNQIGTYSEIARQYGVAIKGVYEVSQIYYQQGLNKGDVMGLTTETLKMARIAGIDYALAADYMTTAIRGFKLEMSDAAHVTDVFSNLAAHTASSTEELATAISKTAASAASVGASFEATSAMMATMIATTRESATNIGTALKSIIARYGELKEHKIGIDSEGEEYSLNKVDTALQTVGISIHDAVGQFRDFDDVILELAESWDKIDKNTQRYIATVMAGNRQQSRFLALVSNVEEYKRALDLANDSSDAGELQVLKTLDSVDAKIERMKVTVQEFYTSSGIEDMYKGILDTITNVISAANDMPKAFGNIPATAMAVGMSVISTIKSVLTLIIGSISSAIEHIKANNSSALQGLVSRFYKTGVDAGEALDKGVQDGSKNLGNSLTKTLSGIVARYAGAIASVMGSNLVIGGMNKYGASTTKEQDEAAGKEMLGGFGLNVFGGALSGAASGAAMGSAAGLPGMAIGAALGTISSLVTNIGSLISGMDMLNVSLARQIELSQKRLEAAKTEETKAKANEKELSNSYEKLIELQEHQFDSIDSAKEYTDYMNQLAETYPAFIGTIQASGDVIIDAEKMEQALADARLNTANATLNAVKAEQNKTELQLENYIGLQSGINQLQDNAMYDEGLVYRLLFNTSAVMNRNRAYDIIGEYNKWAEESGKEIADITPQGYQTKDDAARVWMKNHIAELNAFVEASLLSADNNTELGADQKGALTSARDSLANRFIALVTEAQEAAEKGGETLDISYLVDEDINSLDDIKSWSYSKIKSTLDKTNDRIQKYIDSTNDTLSQVNAAIVRTEIKSAVQDSLHTLRDTGEEGKEQASTLYNYSKLMSGMLAGRYTKHVDWTTETNAGIIKKLEDWVYKHQDEAEQLANLDYNQYRSLSEIDFDSLLVDMDKIDANEYIQKSFKPAFEAARNAVTSGMKTQLKNVNLDESEIADLIDGEVSDTNGELVNSLIPSLRNGIAEYSKLAKKGLSSVANNYLTSLKAIYKSIGQLESDQQIEIAGLISTLDFSDKDALLSAAEELRELGYEDLAISLEDAAQRLVVNIGGGLQALQENTSDIAKDLEKAADKFSKGVKYSDALETVSKLDTKLSFNELYEYSEAANGWVFTQAGIDEQVKSIIAENQKKANELQKDAELRNEVLDLLISSDYISTSMSKGGFAAITQLSGTELDKEYANYQQLVKDFEESGGTNFQEYLEEQLKQNNKYLEQIKDITEDLTTNVLSSTLTSINYADIARGQETDFNKSLIESVLKLAGAGEEVLKDFDDNIWPQMLAGHFESYNDLLSQLGFKASVSNKTATEAQKANIEQYTSGIQELLTASSNALLSDETQALLKEANIDIGTISRKDAANKLVEYVSELVVKGEASIESYNAVLEAANNAVADNVDKALGGGRAKAVLDMAKDGLTVDELKNFVNTYHEKITDFIDEDSHTITNEALASIMEYDMDSGTFKFKAEASADQILSALAAAFNITIENYTDAASQTIASQIAERAKNNQGKQIANQIQALSSAKVGDEIDVSQLTPQMREALSLKDGQQTLVIESEKRRDALLLLLKSSIEAYEGEGKAALQATYDSIKVSIDSKVAPSRLSGLSGMLSTTVDKAGAETFLKSWGYDDLSKIDITTTMKRYGYEWNNFTQTFKATDKALVWANERLKEAQAKGADIETINQLEAQVKKLSYDLHSNPARDALINLLSNYENISNDILAEFAAQFDIDIDNEQFIKEEKGVKKLDIVSLRDNLIEIDEKWAEYFDDYINELADRYINNISTATSLVSSGTTSIADTEKFIKSYQELGFEGDTSQLFNYNSLLQAWTLDGSVLRDYIERQAEQLKLLGYDTTQWYEDQIQNIAKNVDISSYISADDRSITGDAYKELANAMYQYYKIKGYNDKLIDSIISQEIKNLNAGGDAMVATAQKWAERQGKTLTPAEIDSMLSDSVARITDKYTGIIEELVNFTSRDNLSEVAKTAEIELSQGGEAITFNAENALDAAEAFLETLAEQIGKAGYSLEDYNETAKSILDKTLFNKGGNVRALVDFASNNIDSDALTELANSFGIQLNELVNITTGEVLGSMQGYLKYNAASGNYEIQSTFNSFITALEKQFDIVIDRTSQQYIDAFKQFNDNKIDQAHIVDRAVTEELTAVAAAKTGDQINLSQTFTLLQNSLSTLAFTRLKAQLIVLGADFTDGILTIKNSANIPEVIQNIVSKVGEAAELIPEEIAELNDALAEALQSIASLLSNGISGKLSYTDKSTLESWAKDNGIDKLYFQQTADGFKLITSSVEELYEALRKTNPALAQSLLSDIQNEMPQYKDFVSTLQSLNSNVSQTQAALMTQINNASIRGTVATSYEARPHVLDAAGNIQTYYSVSASNEKGATVLVTPILPDGTIMTNGWAANYAEKFANEEITLDTRLVGEDGKNLEYTLKDIFMGLYDSKEAADAAADAYHNYHQAVIEAKEGTDDLTDSVSESSAMMQDLIRTMMTDPNNFKFMDRSLPNEIQSVVNTYESASQAMKTLDQAGKDGYIGVQDFYNIVETASSLMEAAGQEFSVKEQTAAQLMQSAAENLVVVDGKLKIDLSGTGMNIVDGVDEMKGNLTDAIHELAQAQIDMIDAEIKVLEIFAAMEELDDVDVDLDGIYFEVEDIFDDSTESGWTEGAKGFKAWLDGLKKVADLNDEVQDAFKSVQLFNTSFYDLLSMTAKQWLDLGFTKDQVSQVMQYISQHDWSESGAEIQQELSDYLSSLGIPIDINLDHAIYKFGIKGKAFEINWEDKDVKAAVTDYMKTHKGLSQEETQEKINHAINDLGQGKGIGNEVDMLTTLRVLKKVKLDDSGKPTEVVIGGESYKLGEGHDDAYLTAAAAEALGLEIPDNFVTNYESNTTLNTKAKVGSKGKTVDVEVYKDGKTTYKSGGEEADTLDGLMDKLWAKEWEARQKVDANISEEQARKEWEYLNWDIKQPVKTSVTLDNEEVDIKNNQEARDAIRKKIEELPQEDLKLGKDGNLDIVLDNGMHVSLDGDLVVDSNGNVSKEKVAAQLKEMLGIDTALKETITAGITDAFKAIPEALNNIEAKPLQDIATAIQQIALSAATLMVVLPFVSTALGNLKVDINLDEFKGETIGQQIVSAIQSYLDSNPLKLKFGSESEQEEQNLDTSGLNSLTKVIKDISDAINAIKQENGEAVKNASDGLSKVTTENGTAMKDAATALASVITDNGTAVQNAANAIAAVTTDSGNAVKTAAEAVGSINSEQAQAAKAAAGAISDTVGAIANFAAPILQGSLTVSYAISGGGSSAGNMGGGALVGGTVSTLMGELGPELVVSNGRYFLAGQNGAEFVDLAKDAIVFNHLQTQRLMQQGAITGHGKPITNERNAVSYAKGNTGPAMVDPGKQRGLTDTGTGGKKSTSPSSNWPLELLWSILGISMPTLTVTGHSPTSETWPLFASAKGSVKGGPALKGARAAIAQLQKLKAMWQSLLGASAKDLAGLGGGGGGGGGGSKEDQAKAMKAFVKELEKWYNWLQRIAVLEEQINYEEARRNKLASDLVPNGEAYYESQVKTLKLTKEQVATDLALANSQQAHFDKRLKEMNDANNPWSNLYKFDQYGQQMYQDGKLEEFSKLSGRDSLTGEANLTAKEQYEYITGQLGIDPKYLEYDDSGNPIDKSQDDWYVSAVEAFWNKIDSDKEEMQSLHDSIEEHKKAVLEGQSAMNEILHEIQDNQIDLENKVLDAVVDSRERNIEEMEKERDAIEQASSNLIDGLSKQLNKEKDMYQQQQDQDELSKLQRQLSILQRSGGSASQIASLQKEISQKQQDAYFETQQKQIDALQEASDAELERLDRQIELEKEILEYEKLHGLLWNDVYEVLNTKDPQHIAEFINKQNSDRWGNSPTESNKQIGEDLFSAQKYAAYSKDMATVTGQDDTLQKIGDIYTLWEEYVKDDTIEAEAEKIDKEAGPSTEEYTPYTGFVSEPAASTPTPAPEPAPEPEVTSSSDDGSYWRQETDGNGHTQMVKYNASGGIISTGGVYSNEKDENGNLKRLGSYRNQSNWTPKKASGGYVSHGIYELGELGTETVLTAEQTQVLRNNILSNRPNSLISLLKSYNEGYNDINKAAAGAQISDNSIIIQNATVEMNVSKIANDYDAQRAGEQALDKMMQIARKTAAQNRIGR